MDYSNGLFKWIIVMKGYEPFANKGKKYTEHMMVSRIICSKAGIARGI
jgi:hypothetical protein